VCKMWQQVNMAKWTPIVFGSKTYLWMRKYKIVVIFFSFDFEGEMNYSIPLCVNVLERNLSLILMFHWSWVWMACLLAGCIKCLTQTWRICWTITCMSWLFNPNSLPFLTCFFKSINISGWGQKLKKWFFSSCVKVLHKVWNM